MNIDPKADFAGVPLLLVRDLVRDLELRNSGLGFDGDRFRDQYLALGGPPKHAEQVRTRLLAEGLLRPLAAGELAPAGVRWKVSDAGLRLASASAAAPLRRATAEKALAEFLDRVEQVEADPRCVVVVSQVALFGSMLDPDRDRVSDIDVFVETVWCADRVAALLPGEPEEEARILAYQQNFYGARPDPDGPLFDRLVQQRLKGRSRAIQPLWNKTRDWQDTKGALPPLRVIYRREEGRIG